MATMLGLSEGNAMELLIIYDNVAKTGLEPAWGFSCLIEKDGIRILFDTGWDGSLLLANMCNLGVDHTKIDHLFMSHQHWDHVGGVPQVLHPGLTVWMPSRPSKRISIEIEARCRVHRVEGPIEVAPGFYSTGLLGDEAPEQSLLIETSHGIFIVTGCAHAGVGRIMEVAETKGKVTGILGGFHDFDKLDALSGIRTVVPGHCTTRKQEILDLYPDTAIPCEVGLKLHIDD